MAPPKLKRLSNIKKQPRIPSSQAFLNYISADEAKLCKQEITKADDHVRFINPAHISSNLSIDQLNSLKGHEGFDAFFASWMECEIKEEYLNNPPSSYPSISIYQKSVLWSSISKKTTEFCALRSIRSIGILVHHIALRGKLSSLLLLSIGNGEQGSYLCDTRYCISEHHITTESGEVNRSRQKCFGIMMQIHQNNVGAGFITQVKPCVHGRNPEKSLGEQYQYSCRKIHAVITEDKHVVFYK